MFADWQEALEAESLPLNPSPDDELAAVARVTARHARDKDDLADLLEHLGLPTDPDTLTTLLPLLPDNGDTKTMTNAFQAVAISMCDNGDSEEAIREATGMSEKELSDLLAEHLELTPAAPSSPAAPAPASPAVPDDGGIEALLSWAETHPVAGIRNRAARIRTDLTELTERRATNDAQRQAEKRVAKAKAELEAAQAKLREVKSGIRPATASPAAALTPIGSKRSKEELAAIRTWARDNNYQVADRGLPAKNVLNAYDDAHRTTDLAEAS